jgi:hypothetical protein
MSVQRLYEWTEFLSSLSFQLSEWENIRGSENNKKGPQFKLVLGGRQQRKIRSWRRPNCEIWRFCLCVILGVCDSVIWSNSFLLRSVARRWLVERESPSTCATVNWEVCKSEIAPYGLYLNVIKSQCVTQVLINPIIRTRTHRICHAYNPTSDCTY